MKPHLAGLFPEEIAARLAEHGVLVRDDEARRILSHAISPTAARDRERKPLARRLLAQVDELFASQRLEVVERVQDPADKFVKYLFRHPDGALSEAVRIPLHKEDRYSVCLSSQIGCAMRCDFCATGRMGLTRNMHAWEIIQAYCAVRDDVQRGELAPTPGRVTGAVFMGQGEPFHNYDEVIRAARLLSHPCGGRISGEAVTISTVGLVPKIRRFTREGHPFKLIVSLHSAVQARREQLLPVAARYTLEEIADCLREHAAATRTRVTVAWTLMSGVNSGEDEARALQRLLEGTPVIVNLIDVNDARPEGYRRADDAERRAFMNHLQVLQAPIVRRYSGGASRHAACGMLASLRVADAASGPSEPAIAS